MSLEAGLSALGGSVVDLVDQRRTQWRDASGQEFDALFLRPLAEVIGDFQRLSADFSDAMDDAIRELDR